MLPSALRLCCRRSRSRSLLLPSIAAAPHRQTSRRLNSLPDGLRPRFDARLVRLAEEFDQLSGRIGAAASQADAARWSQLKPLADRIGDLRLLRDLAEETRGMIAALTGGGDDATGEEGEDGELVDLARLENRERELAIRTIEVEIARLLLPQRPVPTDCPVLLEVKPGVGGLEAMLFAAELFQMYIAYADYRGWRCDVVEDARADLGGLRSGALEISNGQEIYEELKHETGAHRVQRVPQTGDVIHTSTATVFAIPKPEDLAANFQINPADVEVQLHRSSGPGGQSVNKHQSAVRLLHKPTGIRVDCQAERSQHQNMATANRMLLERVLRRKLEALADEERAARAVQGQRDRSDRIRTYNYQQGRVTDHRVRLTHPDVGSFMSQGQHLQGFIAALRDREEAAELERELAAEALATADAALRVSDRKKAT